MGKIEMKTLETMGRSQELMRTSSPTAQCKFILGLFLSLDSGQTKGNYLLK